MFLVSFGWTGGGCTGRAINSLKFLELETHLEGGFEGVFWSSSGIGMGKRHRQCVVCGSVMMEAECRGIVVWYL